MNGWLQPDTEGCRLHVHVVPRATSTEIVGKHGDALKIRLRAPPVDGKANAALVEFLAEQLALPRHAIRIVAGTAGRSKQLAIKGLNAATVAARLAVAPSG